MAGSGPWIITSPGAVIHDNGGYGMLGMGHSPRNIMDAMGDTHVMANVMTPNFTHKRFSQLLKAEVGQQRGHCPFERFICMNSGSESVTVAFRIADVNAKNQTAAEGPHAGKRIKILSLQGSFHGRTDRPAQASDSCLGKYKKVLASHAGLDNLITIPPNDVEALKAAFASADARGEFIELMLVEPVMGEGDPGRVSLASSTTPLVPSQRRTALCCWWTPSKLAFEALDTCRSWIIRALRMRKHPTWRPTQKT